MVRLAPGTARWQHLPRTPMKTTPCPPPFRKSRNLLLPRARAGLVWLSAAAFCSPMAPAPRAHAIPATEKTPPTGIPIPAEDREKLLRGADRLRDAIRALENNQKLDGKLRDLSPDIWIFEKAVRWAVDLDEFYDLKQVAAAYKLLEEGQARLEALQKGQSPWKQATGRLARGFRSRIDGSVQPYGIVVPEPRADLPKRLDIWLHGRGNKLTELSFLSEQRGRPGEFAPEGTLVVHPYGRFCNAFKFAGETDVLEALAHATAHYGANPKHIAVRGFSMGGAGTWHLAGHMTSRWAVASPGAGFAETAVYASVFAPGKPALPWWEQVLWRLYDMPDHAPNFANRPVVVYSGEIDPQKQAADLMVKAAADAGISLPHLVGPQTGHKFHPETRVQVAKLVDEAAWKGSPDKPRRVHLTTFTLRYNTMDWVEINRLVKHWEKSSVTASVNDDQSVLVQTHGVTDLTLRPPLPGSPDSCPLTIDGQTLTAKLEKGATRLTRVDNLWKTEPLESTPRVNGEPAFEKKHALQGPIDDAFMDAFVFVRPTGKSAHPEVERWVHSEMERAIAQWKIVFRGEVRVVDDTAVTPELMASNHLILWGEPDSNEVMKKVLPNLPLEWGSEKLRLGSGSYEAAHHAPVLIHPNPQAPNRYLVFNSSFTFRQGSDTSNSLQTPKLPDWAVVDLRTPPDAHAPGLIQDAGFFNENWR